MSGLPVIVTRAEPGAKKTAERLKTEGYAPLVSPVLKLEYLETAAPDSGRYQAVLFTSANGVRAFTRMTPDRSLPAYCVGTTTSETARQAGFAEAFDADGNVVSLASLISQKLEAGAGKLLHIVNEAGKNDLSSGLELLGYETDVIAAYRMNQAPALSGEAVRALRRPEGALVLIHSKMGAEAFLTLTEVNKVDLDRSSIIAISERAILPFEALDCGIHYVAEHPNEDGLFEALKQAERML